MIEPKTQARLFHAQYHRFKDDLPFWSSLAEEFGDPILEMGCGTGRVVSALAEKGYRVIAVDQSEAMIDFARKNIPQSLQEKVSFLQCDLTQQKLKEKVLLALGALNTFAYLSDDQFAAALSQVKEALDPKGAIALDLPAYDADPWSADRSDDLLDVFTDPMANTSIEVRAISVGDPGSLQVTWLYDELLPDGRVERHQWDQVYFQRTEAEVKNLFTWSGLKVHAVYGDYDFSRYSSASERLLVLGG
jgi:SAM-dependent methyltransferase